MPVLYIIATPIGNLDDISPRALETLKEADLILCEDTRVTRKLLCHFNIDKPLESYHHHSSAEKTASILAKAQAGKKLALVSDAGTPGVSDPGNRLVGDFIRKFGEEAKIYPIPGPSAVMAAASVAGFAMDKFIFLGFPPHKNKRQKFFKEALSSLYPVIFFESPYRIIKALEEIKSIDCEAELVVLRELSKKFESHYRGKPGEIKQKLEASVVKGEFVIIVRR
ncbi:MAG TPA: 16S rRNA (cytidine(1402)-2'-O)-methyltransferase [Candidatus Pacearchaeota archaeon]|nr:16S rRNA (cytidine(1402)-2'-O)-methyltransferase [Candidatus Pacearchaeota archaeon]